jgi:hypothetical protein
MAEYLDALKCGGWGVFIAPTTKLTVGGGSCSLSSAPSAPALTSARTVAFHCSVADDRWRGIVVTPLAHRTVRCYTGQSGEL